MAAIEGETLELEVKHKVNSSWHPCRATLSSSNTESTINVDFENSNEVDIISKREDALQRLRFRSTPLKDGECSSIKEGDCVLAMHKDQFKSHYFDAVIEKPLRVKHSNRVFCRCTFEIKWLNPEMKDETVTIPSKSIMKLSNEEIDCHPIFTSFLNALGPTEESEVPSTLSFLEENDFEADLNGLLEKHIEEINRHADISMNCSSDLLEISRANCFGHKESESAVTLRTSSNDSASNFKRSTRSQKKEQVKVEESKKELKQDKPFLSPLAARAALASYVHGNELPTRRELSFSHAQNEANLVQKELENFNSVHSFDETWKYTKSGVSAENNLTVLSNSIQESDDISQNFEQKVTKKKAKLKESPYEKKNTLQAWEEPQDETGNSLTITNNSMDLTQAAKLSGRSMTTRVTRSSVHREMDSSPNEVKRRSNCMGLSESVRVTRPRNLKEHSYSGIKLEFRKTDMIENSCDSSEASRNKREESFIASNFVDSMRSRVTRSSAHKEVEPPLDEVGQGSSTKKLPNFINATRLTRSRCQKMQSTPNVDTNLSQSSMVEDTLEKSEDVVPQERKSKKTSISSIEDPKTELHRDGAAVTSEASGAIMEDTDKASAELKKAERKKALSSKKPELHPSPQLNFLPRTRSQKKS